MQRTDRGRKRLILASCVALLAVPLTVAAGIALLRDRRYGLISMLVALLACLPFLVAFEQKRPRARELVVVAVMTAVSTVGRMLFAFVPGFKPVTALVVVTGGALGPEAGFLTGAATAMLSNFFFGQGPWTPFQMLVWGLIGFASGWLGRAGLLKRRAVQVVWGLASGALYSLLMDVWTVLAVDEGFSLARYAATTAASLPFAVMYAVSNVIFLLLLGAPLGRKLARLRVKYGIGTY